MEETARQFLLGPMVINLRSELQSLRKKSIESRKTPDLLWRKLCSVVATSGSSVNARGFMNRYETDLRFELLPSRAEARTKTILKVIKEERVPRMQEQKAKDLSSNYEKIKLLGGPAKATRVMLSLTGKEEKQRWIRDFDGVGVKYSSDIWMDICDKDFVNAIALDARVKSFARAIGMDPKSPRLETNLLQFAESCNLTGWELDRLIYNFGKVALACIQDNEQRGI